MKVSCPNCKKSFNAPSGWAGRQVKCPGCKAPMTLPQGGDSKDSGFDLGALAMMEKGGEAVVREHKGKPMTLKEAQAAAEASQAESGEPVAPKDPLLRTCPGCAASVRSPDLYCDIICRNCGGTIPGKELGKQETRYSTLSDRIAMGTTFYTGFGNAVLYPVPAISSIALGMFIGLAVIATPLFPILGFTGAAGANDASRDQASLGWVGTFLTVTFVLEAIYFGAIAYYVVIDTIRTAVAGNEKPPPLTWNLAKLGPALGGYGALLGFYLAIVLLLFLIRNGSMPSGLADMEKFLSDPVCLAVLALMTFSVPMNMIGLASTQAIDGLNPLKFGPSIGKTIGHYIFLFLMVLMAVGFCVGISYAVMSWLGPMLMRAVSGNAKDGLGKVMLNAALGLGAWSLLIGLALYFAYAMGRILGLFARSYRALLTFEL